LKRAQIAFDNAVPRRTHIRSGNEVGPRAASFSVKDYPVYGIVHGTAFRSVGIAGRKGASVAWPFTEVSRETLSAVKETVALVNVRSASLEPGVIAVAV
jgi:hypothetical protein